VDGRRESAGKRHVKSFSVYLQYVVEPTMRNNVSPVRIIEKNRYIKTEVCKFTGIDRMDFRAGSKTASLSGCRPCLEWNRFFPVWVRSDNRKAQRVLVEPVSGICFLCAK
jgi:hypothetical protein